MNNWKSSKEGTNMNTFLHNMDSDLCAPVIVPLTDLESIEKWSEGQDEFCRAIVPLAKRTLTKDGCHIILWHDMMRNFLDDRFVQGLLTDDAICYCFSNWQFIDAVIYFSHNIISIPPPCWTNAAHRNGTKLLGCLKLEWKMGWKVYQTFFKSAESSEQFATKLVTMANYYRFDGWLINVEKEIQENGLVLAPFLQFLTKKIHEILPDSLILFANCFNYGLVKHALSKPNENILHSCDGIILESNWTVKQLKEISLDQNQYICATIDIWGRSGKEQNGFDCHLAFKSCAQNQVSVALFASAWTYEKYREDFLLAESIFWHPISQFCCSYGYTELPFATTFCKGYGQKLFQHGKVILDDPWLNMSCQQLQPTSSVYHSEQYSVDIIPEENYLILKGIAGTISLAMDFRLYHCEIEIMEPIILDFSYQTVQPKNSNVTLLVSIGTKNTSNVDTIILPSAEIYPTVDLEVDTKEYLEDNWTRILFVIKPSQTYQNIKTIEKIEVNLQLDSNTNERKTILWVKEIEVSRQRDGFKYTLDKIFNAYHHSNIEKQIISFYQQDAYSGGNCLKLSSSLHSNDVLTFSLFKCNFEIVSPLLLSYTIKELNVSSVILELILNNNDTREVLSLQKNYSGKEELLKNNQRKSIDLTQYGIDVERDGRHQWVTKTFILEDVQGKCIKEISLKCHRLKGSSEQNIDIIYLGEIRIIPLIAGYTCPTVEQISVHNKVISTDYVNFICLTCIISWIYPENVFQWFNIFYRSPSEKDLSFYGFASNTFYKISKLKLKKDCPVDYITFYIQPVLKTGMVVPMEECQSISIELEL